MHVDVIFVDSNIPMYLVGADHPNKHPARTIVESAISREHALVSDVEKLQEVLHRHAALRRNDAFQPAFDIVVALVDEVLPIELTHKQRAKELLLGDYGLSARDVLHPAVMEDAATTRINDVRRYPGLDRTH